jgi:hypothetical protein
MGGALEAESSGSIEDLSRRFRRWAKGIRLGIDYDPDIEAEVTRLGGTILQLRNIMRAGTITARGVNRIDVQGRLDNGTTVLMQIETSENPQEGSRQASIKTLRCPTDRLAQSKSAVKPIVIKKRGERGPQ